MHQIGKTVAGIVARASQPTPSNALARPLDTSKPPTIVDHLADIELPRRLICWVPDKGPAELVRVLTEHEKGALERRRNELTDALAPHGEHERAAAKAAIAAMLGGFRSMRQQGEDVAAIAEITRAVLREYPLWAIRRACALIATDNAGLDPKWPPNDAQIYDVVREVVRYHRKALVSCETLLTAVKTPPPLAKPTKEEFAAELAALNLARKTAAHAGYMARVLADIEARKARREAAE